jgi:hypothetical protein
LFCDIGGQQVLLSSAEHFHDPHQGVHLAVQLGDRPGRSYSLSCHFSRLIVVSSPRQGHRGPR